MLLGARQIVEKHGDDRRRPGVGDHRAVPGQVEPGVLTNHVPLLFVNWHCAPVTGPAPPDPDAHADADATDPADLD